MADHDVHLDGVLAPRGPRPLDDPHPERREAELGVAHELEQLGDAGEAGRQSRDGREPTAVHGGGQGGGAIPDPRLGHRGVL